MNLEDLPEKIIVTFSKHADVIRALQRGKIEYKTQTTQRIWEM
jgi:hypothetical protein